MKKPDLEYKILFFGDTCVGKTSLLVRYVDDKFEVGVSTIGVDVRYKYIDYENKRIKLDIWDTAGQEKFKGIAKNYLNGANGVIGVFDITQKISFDNLKLILSSIKEELSSKVEIIIVENKIDLEKDRKVSEKAINEFGEKKNLEIFKASAKTGEGVEDFFMALFKKLYSNKSIGKVEFDEEDDDDEDNYKKNSFSLKHHKKHSKQSNENKKKCC